MIYRLRNVPFSSRDKALIRNLYCAQNKVFTRESSYCFQHVLAIAILSVRPSVCPSHGFISQKRCKLGSSNLHRRLPRKL